MVTSICKADSYVNSSDDSNFGSAESLILRNDPTLEAYAYLRFTTLVLGVRVLIQSTVMHTYWAFGDQDITAVYYNRITGSWEEGAIKWSNKPAYTGTNSAAIGVPPSAGWSTVDISQMVYDVQGSSDEIDVRVSLPYYADGNNSLMRSREVTDTTLRPYIVITLPPDYVTVDIDKWSGWSGRCGDRVEFKEFDIYGVLAWTNIYLPWDRTTILEYAMEVGDIEVFTYQKLYYAVECVSFGAAFVVYKVYYRDTSTIGDFYVTTGGNDSYTGRSYSSSWLTVTKAATTVTDSATVHIEEGSYSGETTIAPVNAGATGIEYIPEKTDGASGACTVTVTLA